MNNSIDEGLSQALFKTTESSWVLRHLAVFFADDLIWLMIGILLGIGINGNELDWQALFTQASLLIATLAIPWLISFGISSIVKRPRPYQKHGFTSVIKPFIETTSFPSAHATFSFALAAFAFTQTGLGWYVLILACCVAIGRVAVGIHYISDILAGSIIGFVFGTMAVYAGQALQHTLI